VTGADLNNVYPSLLPNVRNSLLTTAQSTEQNLSFDPLPRTYRPPCLPV